MERPHLRPYQAEGVEAIYSAWESGNKRPLYVLPTGGGKTVMFSSIVSEHVGAACAVAHRQELVGQISLSFARFGLRHRIIGARETIKGILQDQREELGRVYYDPNAPIAIAGVDTLIRRKENLRRWAEQVTLWIKDEAHHVLPGNKWGAAVEMFPNARGLGVTATPERADGKGLDGVFDTLIQGPSMRTLIEQGYLSDYRIFAPAGDLDLTAVRVANDGDYNNNDLRAAIKKSRIVGDIVETYIKLCYGLLGVTFATDVKTAQDITQQYRARGIAAETLHGGTPTVERNRILRAFKSRQIWQIVAVDIISEGFDVPAIECASMGRPTLSYNVYAQQFGRTLRILPGKTHGIIIDHVGNVVRHNLPDRPRVWTLKGREKKKRQTEGAEDFKITSCTNCFLIYERFRVQCPHCGHKPQPAGGRSRPEQVQGDLYELDAAALESLRGEIRRIDGPILAPQSLTGPAHKALANRWRERQEAQRALRDAIALWAGYRKEEGLTDREIMRAFWERFAIDIMTAQTLNRADAEVLTGRVWGNLGYAK